MAFIINKNKYDNYPNNYKYIAKENITVYKFGYLQNGLFKSYNYQDFVYKPNVVSKTIIPQLFDEYDNKGKYVYQIKYGYHAYSENCSCYINNDNIYAVFEDKQTGTPYNINTYIGIFIIPDGTIYYKNDYEEIVSSAIMWTGKCITPQYNEQKLFKNYEKI